MFIVKLNLENSSFLQKIVEKLMIAGWEQMEIFNWEEISSSLEAQHLPEELIDREKLLKEGKYYVKVYLSSKEEKEELEEFLKKIAIPFQKEELFLDEKTLEEYLKIKTEIKIDDKVIISSLPLSQLKKDYPQFKYHISLVPGAAFGTGEHETTYSCLQGLLELEGQFSSVLDIGTGSGILSLLSSLMGADRIVAFDIDSLSVETARENAQKNEIEGIKWFLGDVFKVSLKEKFDLVIANIYADILKESYPKIKDWSEKWLILSGIYKDKWPQVKEVYEKGFSVYRLFPLKEWQTVILKKKGE